MADAASVPPPPQTPPPGDDAAADPGATSLLGTVASLLRDLPGLVSDRLELLGLELKQAGAALAKILVFLVAAAFFAFTAWLLLWAGIVSLLVGFGLYWGWAVLIALLLNLGAGAVALMQTKKLLPQLRLPATRRHLTLDGLTPPPASHPDRSPNEPIDRHGQPVAP